jgi:hypothetical protein
MFDHIHAHAAQLHDEMKVIFWLLLTPLVCLLITLEVLKSEDKGPNVQDIIKRTVLAIIMLILFDFTLESIAAISDGVTAQISDKNELLEAVKKYGSTVSNADMGFFDFRKHILFFFALGSYLFAYIGYFTSAVLVNFLWAVLYVFSPLMILCFIPKSTSYITNNLYRSLIKVSIWKVVWAILGAFLLKMAVVPEDVGFEGAMFSMVMNLVIGLSMLLVPVFTRSLIADGLQNAASGLAVAPALLAVKVAAAKAKLVAGKGLMKGKDGVGFVGRPLVNPIRDRLRGNNQKVAKRFNNLKYSVNDFLEDEQSGNQPQIKPEAKSNYRSNGYKQQRNNQSFKAKQFNQQQNFKQRRSKQ